MVDKLIFYSINLILYSKNEVHSYVMEHDPQWVIVRSLCDLRSCEDQYSNQIGKILMFHFKRYHVQPFNSVIMKYKYHQIKMSFKMSVKNFKNDFCSPLDSWWPWGVVTPQQNLFLLNILVLVSLSCLLCHMWEYMLEGQIFLPVFHSLHLRKEYYDNISTCILQNIIQIINHL